VILSTGETLHQPVLPAIDARVLVRRIALPALAAGAAVAALLLLGAHVQGLAATLQRELSGSPWWTAVAVLFECISLAGYVGLLSLVAGRATSRVGTRESAQIALAGAAATRLLPTAGAGGLALMLWALRRAGLRAQAASHHLLVFLVVLYSVFLGSVALIGGALSLGLAGGHTPIVLTTLAATGAALAIATCLILVRRVGVGRHRRIGLFADALRGGCKLIRTGEPRLAGGVVYWLFDAAALWAMLHAFGRPPALPIVVFAYFVGQVANTLPLPGSVSAGTTGVLVAFGAPAAIAIPSVLAYRAVAVWLPTPAAMAAVPALRATVARWTREGATAAG
jgi:uncharacterized membrane protein YbhN (UPF0104 family)